MSRYCGHWLKGHWCSLILVHFQVSSLTDYHSEHMFGKEIILRVKFGHKPIDLKEPRKCDVRLVTADLKKLKTKFLVSDDDLNDASPTRF